MLSEYSLLKASSIAEKVSTLSSAPVAPSMSEACRSWRVKAGSSSWSQAMSSRMAIARTRGVILFKVALSRHDLEDAIVGKQ